MPKRKGKEKQVQRSILSNRVTNGKSVVLCSEAIEYVKKMGFSVMYLRCQKQKIFEELNEELEKYEI